jgi:murein DD-endopeptidase MepM/ murein hydrolase activator NlpD
MQKKPIQEVFPFITTIIEYLQFLKQYFRKRAGQGFHRFESAKSILVDGLVAKRGKYVRPFLHSSMSSLFLVGLMVAPLVKGFFPEDTAFATQRMQVLGASAVEKATTTEISVKPRDSVVSYTVKSGDTLSSIAQKFNVSEDTVRWQNDLKKDNPVLKPGDTLEIPPVTGLVHKVKRGETIYSIAKKYSVNAQAIVNWPFNTFTDDEDFDLAVGQMLIVPDGTPPQEEPAPQKQYYAQKTPSAGNVSGSGQFIWPASGGITQYYRWYHPAIDIANKSAPNVVAADAGKVIYSGCFNWGYGCHVIVDHGNGYSTLYAHLSSLYVSQGQTVSGGAALGRMGSTGRSTGTHLHFEIRKSGSPQNPMSYLQ